MFHTKKDTKPPEFYAKEWFIIVENQQEGPFSLLDLRKDERFTPDTLVWKKGFHEWTAARFVAELQEVFKDEEPSKPLSEPEKVKGLEPDLSQDQATLALQQDPYQFFLWLIVLLLILFYTYYQFTYN